MAGTCNQTFDLFRIFAFRAPLHGG
jgi:hypothetical protein